MAAKYILSALAVLFFAAAAICFSSSAAPHPQTRAWLLIGAIFAVVSAYLFYQG